MLGNPLDFIVVIASTDNERCLRFHMRGMAVIQPSDMVKGSLTLSGLPADITGSRQSEADASVVPLSMAVCFGGRLSERSVHEAATGCLRLEAGVAEFLTRF